MYSFSFAFFFYRLAEWNDLFYELALNAKIFQSQLVEMVAQRENKIVNWAIERSQEANEKVDFFLCGKMNNTK